MSVIEQRSPVLPPSDVVAPHVLKPSKKKFRNALLYTTAGALTSIAVAGGVAGKNYSDDAMLLPKVVAGALFNNDCDTRVTQKDIASVHNILRKPRDISASYDESYLDTSMPPFDYRNTVIEEAKKKNLTVIDNRPALEKLDKANSIDEILPIINEYTSHFNLRVEIPESTGMQEVGFGITAASKEEINMEQFKKGAETMLYSFSYLPTEVFKLSEINTFKIVDSIHPHVPILKLYETNPPMVTNPVTHTIYARLSAFGTKDANDFNHEYNHGVDYAECGFLGMLNDPQYKSLNPKGFRYGSENKGSIGSVVEDDYSEEHVIEDKETIMQDKFSGFSIYIILDKVPPVIEKKQELLLARLEKKVPHITEYIRYIN